MLHRSWRRSAGWQSGPMSPIEPDAPDVETPQHEDGRGNTRAVTTTRIGITVNSLGVRFFDEGEAEHSYTYAKTGWAVLGQPGARAYPDLRSEGPDRAGNIRTTGDSEEADTIAELLPRRSASSPSVLTHTVEEIQPAVSDDTPFDPSRADGKAAQRAGLPKSNWATRIDEPPFRAYPVTCGITFTFGGVEVNRTRRS